MDKEELERVAKIARLSLTEEEKISFARDLEEVQKIFAQIDEVDIAAEPAFQPIEVKNRTREDKPGECFSKEETFSNTEHREGDFFKGPKV
jgi:aspartyl-tRNA(Asn)/glutamyl-tRNA(Gln) amidotransferase subunit C